MTIVSIKNELSKAQREHYAVPLFDVFEMQGMEGVMEALTEKRAPTIIGIYSPHAALPNCRAFAAYVRSRAEDTDVPISLMLDHGASVELCERVLDYGFTDVMYDGSSLPIEENIAKRFEDNGIFFVELLFNNLRRIMHSELLHKEHQKMIRKKVIENY